VTSDTGVGDPSRSSADKGAKYVAAVAAKIGEFLVELASADLEKLYE
jgi:creatinine amidohydrolase